MKKRILLTVAVLIVAAGFSFAADYIGIAMPETHVERWVKDGAALKADAEAKGYKAEVAYGDADQGKQNQQIQDMLTKGAKLLVIGTLTKALKP